LQRTGLGEGSDPSPRRVCWKFGAALSHKGRGHEYRRRIVGDKDTNTVLAPSPPDTAKFPLRSIILLACAGFASQAMVRVTDSLLPQIATDFNTSVGEAAIVISAYS